MPPATQHDIRRAGIPGLPAASLLAAAIAALAFGVSLFAGCGHHPVAPAGIGGLYQYTAYDSGGAPVVTGTITLVNRDSTNLTGRWDLRAADGAGNIGPQTGRGLLAGSTADGISIDLTPGFADNNVILVGTFEEDEISGTWHWITFIGETARGRFEMIRP